MLLPVVFLAGALSYHLLRPAVVEHYLVPYKSLAITAVPVDHPLKSYERALLAKPVTQNDGAICGAAAVQAVLQSFGLQRDQRELLDSSQVIDAEQVYVRGMTLDQLAALMAEQGEYTVQVIRPRSLPELRAVLARLADPRFRAIVNYSRMPLTGENIGHHTSILAFDPLTDMAVLQDVTPGYGNYRLPLAVVLTAIMTPDSDTGEQRGLVLVSAGN